MKSLITLALLVSLQAQATWMPTDGTIDFKCGDGVNNFEFKAFYKAGAQPLELAYDVTVMQFPFLGAEIKPVTQVVPGCTKAPLEMGVTNSGVEVYFECAADGDAGFGTITANFATGDMKAEINFPEGQPTLNQPIPDGATLNLPCDFLF